MRTALVLLLRPILWLVLGLSVGHAKRLPVKGPAIVAANHNSHVDTLVLLSAFRLGALRSVRPVAAADYFLKGRVLRFIALRLIGIVALDRTARRGEPLGPALNVLADGGILVVFPEGTRGAPEVMGAMKSGLARLARDGNAPITPVYLQGAGRILPKGARLPVPFTCTMLVGKPIAPSSDRASVMAALGAELSALRAQAPPLHWS